MVSLRLETNQEDKFDCPVSRGMAIRLVNGCGVPSSGCGLGSGSHGLWVKVGLGLHGVKQHDTVIMYCDKGCYWPNTAYVRPRPYHNLEQGCLSLGCG